MRGICTLFIVPVLLAQTPAAVLPAAPAAQSKPAPAAPPKPAPPGAEAADEPGDAAATDAAGAAVPAGPTPVQLEKLIAGMRAAALAYAATLPSVACTRVSRFEIMAAPAPASAKGAAKPAPKAAPKSAAPSKTADPKAAALQKTDSKTADTKVADTKVADTKTAAPKPATQAAADDAEPDNFQLVDLREETLIWSNKQEQVSARPGTPKTPIPDTSGITDFVGILNSVFAETSHAEFELKGLGTLRSIPVFVFEYKVPKENSTQEVQAGTARITVGYHGVAVVDRRTGRILRINSDPEIPSDFPVQDVNRVFDFGQSLIGGQFVLMPLQSKVLERGSLELLRDGKAGGKSPQILAQTTTIFQSCHRYLPPRKPVQ